MNSSLAAYNNEQFILDFMDCNCTTPLLEPNEYDESIAEAQAMLDYAIDIGDKNEIYQWRKMIQRIKVEKRLAKVEYKNKKENMLS